MDICGPMHIESMGENKFFLLLVDDYTHMTWIFFLMSKGEAYEKFQIFQAMVERESVKKIKILRSDRGGEFLSREFSEYCDKAGIQCELTPLYMPQHNDMVERKNRTVTEKTRCLLKCSGLPASFWAEATVTIVYLMNISLTITTPNETPYELWTGVKPNVKHLRVFRCIAMVQVPTQKWYKLDDK